MTFQDLIAQGYKKPNCVDAMTWEMLQDWFAMRRIIPNFVFYFERALKLHFPYYRELLRVDPSVSQYDWFIEEYNESYSEDLIATESKTEGHSTHDDGENGQSTSNSVSTGSSNNTNVNKASGENRNIVQARNNPMSVSYTQGDIRDFSSYKPTVDGESVGQGIGHGIANPMMVNPSATTDEFDRNNNVSKDQNQAAYSDNNTGSSNFVTTRSGSATDNNNQKINSDNVKASINSGRHELPANVIAGARSTIMASESWNWFYRQMDKCFYQCYNI